MAVNLDFLSTFVPFCTQEHCTSVPLHLTFAPCAYACGVSFYQPQQYSTVNMRWLSLAATSCGGGGVSPQPLAQTLHLRNAVSDTPATPTRIGQISIGSLDQLGTLLPSTALTKIPQSFTVDSEQVLGQIPPVKRLKPTTILLKRICFDLKVLVYLSLLWAYYFCFCPITKDRSM